MDNPPTPYRAVWYFGLRLVDRLAHEVFSDGGTLDLLGG